MYSYGLQDNWIPKNMYLDNFLFVFTVYGSVYLNTTQIKAMQTIITLHLVFFT